MLPRRLRTLRLLTGLIAEREPPSHPDGRETPWRELVTLATQHGLAPALWVALRHRPELVVPARVQSVLGLAYRRNIARNLLLKRETGDAVRALNREGVEPLLIKGSLYLFDGTFAPGVRYMSDIDMVVPEAEQERAGRALRCLGYTPDPGKPFLHPHELPFGAAGAHAPIELHVALGSSRVASVLPLADAWAHSRPAGEAGLRFRGLSGTHAVVHNILHAQVQDLNHAVHGIALRQMHTLVGLERARRGEIDWHGARALLETHGLGDVHDSYVRFANRLFGMPLAESVSPAPDMHNLVCLLSFQLRWAADVRRNMAYAFGAEYMRHRYGLGDTPGSLVQARARHAWKLAISQRGDRVPELLTPTR
ncbi:MAG: nucleotidyltransferase family protein [Candidatus Dormibacteria bacterium]